MNLYNILANDSKFYNNQSVWFLCMFIIAIIIGIIEFGYINPKLEKENIIKSKYKYILLTYIIIAISFIILLPVNIMKLQESGMLQTTNTNSATGYAISLVFGGFISFAFLICMFLTSKKSIFISYASGMTSLVTIITFIHFII